MAGDASPAPSPASDRPRLERVAEKLTAIVDTDTDPDRVIRAGRLLASEELRATVRKMEMESEWRAQEPQRLAREKRLLDGVADVYPSLSPEDVERLTLELCEFSRPKDLATTLKREMGFWDPPPITTEVLSRLWLELGLPGDQGPNPEPRSPVAGKPRPLPDGLRKLPPDDAARLAAREIEREYERRERIKHPGQVVPEPPAVRAVEPEPTEPPDLPAYADPRVVWFADLPVFPGLLEE